MEEPDYFIGVARRYGSLQAQPPQDLPAAFDFRAIEPAVRGKGVDGLGFFVRL